jgi:L-fuculose-phosphate aldolase
MAEFDLEQIARELLDGVGSAADAVGNAARDAGDDLARFRRFAEIGRDLFISGGTTSHGGNLSECDGAHIWITRTGSMLGHITPGDIIACGIEPSAADDQASMELLVHRAIYQALPSGAWAIVHAHTRYTVLRSLLSDQITPPDSEGQLVCGTSVPVLTAAKTVASAEVAQLMAEHAAAGGRLAVIKGHGPFAVAPSLPEAFRLISNLEYSAQLQHLLEKC